jgi:hypothetical protein
VSDFNVTRAYAEDYRPCVADHAAMWEEERGIDVVLTITGTEFPFCRTHAEQLREMFDEELTPSGSADAARAAGAGFYEMPDQINVALVDELIRPVVARINQSGWVWTGESCQGHPDATHHSPWAGNTRPMLRLITHQNQYGNMLDFLLRATHYEEDGLRRVCGLDVWEHERKGAYCEVLVYVKASTVYERDLGIACFARFAKAISPRGTADV